MAAAMPTRVVNMAQEIFEPSDSMLLEKKRMILAKLAESLVRVEGLAATSEASVQVVETYCVPLQAGGYLYARYTQ